MSIEVLNKYLKKIDDEIKNGEYKDNWESLSKHTTPEWYRKAKFGIFIHWGVYSVPAYGNEWYPRLMYRQDGLTMMYNDKPGRCAYNCFKHHIETYGPHKEFGYKDFIPMFKAEKFNPKEWAELFKNAGAKFVMPVAEHHDGFQMYDSDISEWCASKMGPKQDILGELKREIEKEGMTFTASSHRIEHYWFMDGGREFDSDFPKEIPYGHLYWPSLTRKINDTFRVEGNEVDKLFMEDWLVRTCEIVDKYRPKIVYFDEWIHIKPMKPYLKKFAAYYYNRAKEWNEEVTINYKGDAFMYKVGNIDYERKKSDGILPEIWQIDTTVGSSWGYVKNNKYKNPVKLIQTLIDVVSKNGVLLLNIGPKPDGTIPDEDAAILMEIGDWLKVNGEGIYSSSYWKVFGEGPSAEEKSWNEQSEYTSEDFRFTYKEGVIYAFAMRWPENGVVKIKSLGGYKKDFRGVITDVTVLGAPNGCRYERDDECLTVAADGLKKDRPVCIKIDVD